MVALAGANGTGKSKLLACLLSPWSRVVPAAGRDGVPAEVRVEIEVSDAEARAIETLSAEANWGVVQIPLRFVVGLRLQPDAGLQLFPEPENFALRQVFISQEFLRRHPSLNIVYLPAERRLLPSSARGIDLNQLSELMAVQQNANAQVSVREYGKLDDQEFEEFAKALCVAASLPSEGGSEAPPPVGRIQWPEFADTVNSLIAPKRLLPLTRQHPEQLRIEAVSGAVHSVQDLSSGERQALIIISRVLRAGVRHSAVLIDEPDAYLHPNLSQKLTQALTRGVGTSGQLIVATHSPAVLDHIPPDAILRLSHEAGPRPVADEMERVELYRSAGFRASALTQSDLLVITEGESDASILTILFPELARASVRAAGGRARVFREVEQLAPFDLPIVGVVDRDVIAPAPPPGIERLIAVWPTADIEGAFLSDDSCIESMIRLGLLKDEYRSVDGVKALLATLVENQRDNVLAELAQRRLREGADVRWPSPRGENPLDRLRGAVSSMVPLASGDVDDAISRAEKLWNDYESDRWALVRGKYVLGGFVNVATHMRSGRALLEATARDRPPMSRFETFRRLLAAVLPGAAA